LSKLSEALQKKRRGESARVMGFGAQAAEKDRALLIGAGGESGAEALEAGADFVAVAADDAESAIAALDGLDGLLGVQIASLTEEDVTALEEAGADFAIVNAEAAAASIVESELGLVLEVDEAWEDAPLRALATLSLDAVLVRSPVTNFTVARRISLGRIAALCGVALIVTVTPSISSSELAALRETGAGGIIPTEGTSSDEFSDLIEHLEAVPARNTNRRIEGGFAIVPPAGSSGEQEEFEDDD